MKLPVNDRAGARPAPDSLFLGAAAAAAATGALAITAPGRTAHHVAGAGRLAVTVAQAACTARFFGREFVRRPLGMRGLSALAGDFALACRIHRCEAAVAGATGTLTIAGRARLLVALIA